MFKRLKKLFTRKKTPVHPAALLGNRSEANNRASSASSTYLDNYWRRDDRGFDPFGTAMMLSFVTQDVGASPSVEASAPSWSGGGGESGGAGASGSWDSGSSCSPSSYDSGSSYDSSSSSDSGSCSFD